MDIELWLAIKLAKWVPRLLNKLPKLNNWVARKVEANAAVIQARSQAETLEIEAESKSNAMQSIMDGFTTALEISNDLPFNLEGTVSITDTIQVQLKLKQKENLNSVMEMFRKELANKVLEDDVTENKKIDPDWLMRFFADVQDVSDKYIQHIWAKILAGEAETPGRISLKTLSILKDMSRDDAMLFERVMRFCVGPHVLDDRDLTEKLIDFPTLDEFLTLQQHDLLQTGFALGVQFMGKQEIMSGGGYTMRIFREDGKDLNFHVPMYVLLPSGRELRDLLQVEIDLDYLAVLTSRIESSSSQCRVTIEKDGVG